MKLQPASISLDGKIFLWEGPNNDVASRDKNKNWLFGRDDIVPTADELKDEYHRVLDKEVYLEIYNEAIECYYRMI